AVPLWPTTAQALQAWFGELGDGSGTVAFPNARGAALTRDGVNYLLQQAVERAARSCPSLRNKPVSPHLLRHTCALHLLQSGVDIAVIALWLGHENIQTTHGYIEADLILKEQALQKMAPAGQVVTRFKADDALLRSLSSL
ncbi:MAG: tyrosine-type recombinase/integrase, partial [Pyrinomonadaceae bacterium]|nr:tyrosine-type recombinase/integrase [Pyrinomonadaceae bacterium]